MALSLGLAWSVTFGVSVFAVIYVVLLGKKGIINRLLARKVMHTGTGPAFLLCWCLFPNSPWSPILASSVIFILAVYFALVGMGLFKAQALVNVISRSGKKSELLVGPILYGIVHMAAAVMYWFDSPIGFVSVMVLCLGDGVADIVGRRFGKSNPLPWNKLKSVAGSSAFWLGGYLGTLAIAEFYFQKGFMDATYRENFAKKSALVVTAATLVESLPLGGIDNITIFFACIACGRFCSWS